MTSIIQQYLDLKWEIIPIRPAEKIPYVEYGKYKEVAIEESEILGWLAQFDAAEWAVLTGKGNRVLLDFDDPNIYDTFFSDIITKKVMITPSGGVSCIVNSTVVPRSTTKFNGLALDLKGPGSYAVVPSQDLTESQLADEVEKYNVAAADKDSGLGADKPRFIRRWIHFDPEADDEFEDIEKILLERLPKIEKDVKKQKGTPSAIEWAKGHGIPVKYEGHGYIQCNCFLKSHVGEVTRPSLTIYDNGYYCFSCQSHGGLYKLIKEFTGKTDDEIRSEFPDIKKQKKTINDMTIQIIEDKCTLIRDHNNNSFLKLNDYTDMGINLLPANSKITRYWISSTVEEELEKYPTAATLSYVMQHFDAKASAKGEKAKIYRRIGGDMDGIWYDLGGNSFVKITKDTFGIYPETSLTFMRETNEGMQSLPAHRNAKDVMKLFKVVNVPDPNQQLLIVTWLVNAFLPWAQFPILLLCGSRGSGKSWLARILKRLVDPVEGNASELLVNKPRDVNYLIHLLSHNACAVLDNLSFIDTEMSDVLCQVVTGGVMPTRELYTTNDSVLIDIKSRLIITAINKEIFESGTGDLAERTIAIEIDRPEGKYVTEESLTEDFDSVRADILGGILALVQGYLRDGMPKRGESSEFRMTTYAAVGKYITKVLSSRSQDFDFSRAYRINQLGMSRNTLEAEPVTDFILWFAENFGGRCIDCTPVEGWGVDKKMLFDKFFNDWVAEKQVYGDKKLPKSASKLLSKLKRIAPDLLKIYKIEVKNTGLHKNKDWILIRNLSTPGPLGPDVLDGNDILPDEEINSAPISEETTERVVSDEEIETTQSQIEDEKW